MLEQWEHTNPARGMRVPTYGARPLKKSASPLLIVRYAFYVFVFSIPFEAVDIGTTDLSLSRLLGLAFISMAVLQRRLCFGRLPKTFWFFSLYLFIFALWGLQGDSQVSSEVIAKLKEQIQMLILLWVSYNLMQHEGFVKGTLWSLTASCVCLAVLQTLNLTSTDAGTAQVERVSSLGQGVNTFAATLSLGLIALVGLAFLRKQLRNWVRLLVWPCFGVVAISVVRTGSRGVMLGVVAGLLAFILKGRELTAKLKYSSLAALAVGILVWMSYQSADVRTRWEASLVDGNLSSREKILPAAWDMFLEKPLTGWGPDSLHTYELGQRSGHHMIGPHNLYLKVLLETGILGAVPFLVGIWICLKGAWKARAGREGVLPIALLSCVLLINMSMEFQKSKLQWIVLAYALASGSRSASSTLPRASASIR